MVKQSPQTRFLKARKLLTDTFPDQAGLILEQAHTIEDLDERSSFVESQLLSLCDMAEKALTWKNGQAPVDFETFMTSPEYMDWPDPIWPEVMKACSDINSGKYVEAVLTGGIGVAKTTIALWTIAYQLYYLSCYRQPQRELGIGSSDEIVFIIQSITGKQAKEVGYDRLRAMLEEAPYFRDRFPFDGELKSQMVFPNRIKVLPVSGAISAAIGQNVFGGLLDEVNFMQYVESSKQSRDGGTFDQAQELYLAIKRRRQSRFMVKGTVPGMLCLVSSKQYPGEFTERKAEEARKEIVSTGKTSIYVYDKRVWEVKPPGEYLEELFRVFVGDQTRKPRILAATEEVAEKDAHLIMHVPMDFYQDFQENLLAALREIGGIATLALHPFILDVESIYHAFGRTLSVLDAEECDFVADKIAVLPKRFINLDQPRFVHIDLAITGDAAGLACGYVRRFVKVPRSNNEVEILPEIVYDFVLRVRPPVGGEIIFEKVREVLYRCRDLGLPIRWVTLDSFQSTDTKQILNSKGFITGTKSVDTDNAPYDILKSGFTDQRVLAPAHEVAPKELSQLEKIAKTQRIDHPANGSKDCSDAMAGVAFGLFTQMDIWLGHGITPAEIEKATQAHVT